MTTSPQTIAHLTDVLPGTTARAMFGEYALYCEGRVIGLICNDTLFVKPVKGILALMPGAALGPPYPGAKDHVIVTDDLDDADLMARMLHVLVAEVPLPKPKKAR
jgi:TfoX/Sxy family transcriptional regulator of competence genes